MFQLILWWLWEHSFLISAIDWESSWALKSITASVPRPHFRMLEGPRQVECLLYASLAWRHPSSFVELSLELFQSAQISLLPLLSPLLGDRHAPWSDGSASVSWLPLHFLFQVFLLTNILTFNPFLVSASQTTQTDTLVLCNKVLGV